MSQLNCLQYWFNILCTTTHTLLRLDYSQDYSFKEYSLRVVFFFVYETQNDFDCFYRTETSSQVHLPKTEVWWPLSWRWQQSLSKALGFLPIEWLLSGDSQSWSWSDLSNALVFSHDSFSLLFFLRSSTSPGSIHSSLWCGQKTLWTLCFHKKTETPCLKLIHFIIYDTIHIILISILWTRINSFFF